MDKEEINILNYLKQYLQDKIDGGYHKLFYGENDYDFKTIDAINAIEELQHQLEEKNNVIAEILNYPFFTNDCPLSSIDDENNKILKLCDCDNCEDDYEKCWLKYFENETLKRGKNENNK